MTTITIDIKQEDDVDAGCVHRFPMVRTGGSTNTLNETRRRLETLSPCIVVVTIRHYHFESGGEHSGFDGENADDESSRSQRHMQ